MELEKRWEIRESGANEQDLGTPWNVGAGRRNQGLGQLGQDGALRQRNAKLGVFLGYLANGADGTCGREGVQAGGSAEGCSQDHQGLCLVEQGHYQHASVRSGEEEAPSEELVSVL